MIQSAPSDPVSSSTESTKFSELRSIIRPEWQPQQRNNTEVWCNIDIKRTYGNVEVLQVVELFGCGDRSDDLGAPSGGQLHTQVRRWLAQ